MIEHITLTDIEEEQTPPKKVLRLAVVDDTVFLALCKPQDRYKDGDYNVLADGEAQIAINAYDLLDSLKTLTLSDQRDAEFRSKNG